MPTASAAAAPRGLLQAPDHRALGGAVVGEPLGLVVGAGDARQADQAEERRQGNGAAHPAKSAEAACWALSISGPGFTKKNSMTMLVMAMMPFITQPVSLSRASTGSSKYITLMIRR